MVSFKRLYSSPKSTLLSFPREVDANENEYRNLQKKKNL